MQTISEGRYYLLPSGLEVNLHQVPHLNRAAVVWIFPVGSHQEPTDWPGLAHLTEHMLFSGGTKYRDQQRLMPWIQQKGGRINATTQQNYTAYYFEVDPDDLAEGVLRLQDMLFSPRLSVTDLERETAVIDEEFQLYSHSPTALASAALQSQICEPVAFTRFHIGNAASFGRDLAKLSIALQDFYTRHYSEHNSQIWIASPYTCQQQYQAITPAFLMPDYFTASITSKSSDHRVSASSDITWRNWQGEIRLAQQPGLGISAVLRINALSDWSLFVELITDTAPGSFAQVISERLGRYLSVRIERHYHDNKQIFFTFWLEGTDFSEQEGQECLLIWHHWRQAVAQLSSSTLAHYYRLALISAKALPAMDFLREHTLGFAVTAPFHHGVNGKDLQQSISSIDTYALLHSRRDSPTVSRQCQGLTCYFRASLLAFADPKTRHYPFLFYPQPQCTTKKIPPVQERKVPYHWENGSSGRFYLLIRPAAGAAISYAVREELMRALSPVFSLAKHFAGKAMWQQMMGNDVLYFNFEHLEDLEATIEQLISYWPRKAVKSSLEDYPTLPLRQLLQNMPSLLADQLDSWTLSFIGPCQDSVDQLSAKLGHLPIRWQKWQGDEKPLQQQLCFQSHSNQATLIAFIPYRLHSRHAFSLYQQLAGYYESAFYAQLREVEAVGYAVACRQRIFRDRWGLQIILQSSHLSVNQLYASVVTFFRELVVPNEFSTNRPSLESEKQGDNDLDQWLLSTLRQFTSGGSYQEPATIEEAHRILVDQVSHKEGGWIFFE